LATAGPATTRIASAAPEGHREDRSMTTADDGFRRLVRDAAADPAILGLVLTGSRGKGFGSAASDYDVLVVVRDGDDAPVRARLAGLPPGIDWRVMTLGAFAGYAAWDGPFAWDRYGFAHATVLVDRTGRVRELVEEKGSVPAEHRDALVRAALDAHINGDYRSLKCLRNGNRLGARLEAADALGHALTAIFALAGRLRPYHGYLERELRAFPLRSFPLDADALLALVAAILDDPDPAAQQRLLAVVVDACRAAGHGDVIEGWGAAYEWMTTFRLPPPA
jgi:hypothetical protein